MERDPGQTGGGPSGGGASSDLAGHHRGRSNRISRLRGIAHGRLAENLAQRLGDRWASIRARGGLCLAHVQPIALELDVLPAQPVYLLAPQASVEGEGIRHLVVGLERREQFPGFLDRCHARARFLVVGR
jgi:hypothetical protein